MSASQIDPLTVVLSLRHCVHLDADPLIATRQCLELAELTHLGSMTAYVAILKDYLAQCEERASWERP